MVAVVATLVFPVHKKLGTLVLNTQSGAPGLIITSTMVVLVALYVAWMVEGTFKRDVVRALRRPVFWTPLLAMLLASFSINAAQNSYLAISQMVYWLFIYALFLYFGARVAQSHRHHVDPRCVRRLGGDRGRRGRPPESRPLQPRVPQRPHASDRAQDRRGRHRPSLRHARAPGVPRDHGCHDRPGRARPRDVADQQVGTVGVPRRRRCVPRRDLPHPGPRAAPRRDPGTRGADRDRGGAPPHLGARHGSPGALWPWRRSSFSGHRSRSSTRTTSAPVTIQPRGQIASPAQRRGLADDRQLPSDRDRAQQLHPDRASVHDRALALPRLPLTQPLHPHRSGDRRARSGRSPHHRCGARLERDPAQLQSRPAVSGDGVGDVLHHRPQRHRRAALVLDARGGAAHGVLDLRGTDDGVHPYAGRRTARRAGSRPARQPGPAPVRPSAPAREPASVHA